MFSPSSRDVKTAAATDVKVKGEIARRSVVVSPKPRQRGQDAHAPAGETSTLQAPAAEFKVPNPPIREAGLGFWITAQGIGAEGSAFEGMGGAITAGGEGARP
ncbi:MAG: hypothetical protein ACLQVL_18485, partial [Terriglobia bacterium]